MTSKNKEVLVTQREYELTRRYLIWFYKSAKEDLDKIDRYFTQVPVDAFVLNHMRQEIKEDAHVPEAFKEKVDAFEQYMMAKKTKAEVQKFFNVEQAMLTSDYLYLKIRLESVEKAIVHFLGEEALIEINTLYETEMSRRILEARDH